MYIHTYTHTYPHNCIHTYIHTLHTYIPIYIQTDIIRYINIHIPTYLSICPHRYRRMDEAGTPFCVTVDFDTLEHDTVTVRMRDSTEQIRMPVEEIFSYFSKEIDGY